MSKLIHPPRPHLRLRRGPCLALLGALAAACGPGGCYDYETRRLVQEGGKTYRVLDQGLYRAYYDPSGQTLLWIQYDANHDGHPEQVDHHEGAARARWSELDADSDGRVERWEYFDEQGRPRKVGTSRRQGVADRWVYLDAEGHPLRAERDVDGDGKFERIEVYEKSRVSAVQIDSEGDGRIDRWQRWADGRLEAEGFDTDGDNKPDRWLRYDARGQLLGMDREPGKR